MRDQTGVGLGVLQGFVLAGWLGATFFLANCGGLVGPLTEFRPGREHGDDEVGRVGDVPAEPEREVGLIETQHGDGRLSLEPEALFRTVDLREEMPDRTFNSASTGAGIDKLGAENLATSCSRSSSVAQSTQVEIEAAVFEQRVQVATSRSCSRRNAS